MSLDDKQFNTLLSTIKNNVPKDCAAYNDIRDKSNKSTTVLGKTRFSMSDYEAYRNDIEFVNLFSDQVLVDERNYFEKKYTPQLYKYLLSQRQSYREQQTRNREDLLCGGYKKSLEDLKAKAINPPACDNGNGNKNKFMDYLMSQNALPNIQTMYKKIEYRNEAHELISTINRWMTILYFVLLLGLIVTLAVSNKLMLRERYVLYLFLIALPFLLPYLFELIKYLYRLVFPPSKIHGPKNAFLETNGVSVDSFNM